MRNLASTLALTCVSGGLLAGMIVTNATGFGPPPEGMTEYFGRVAESVRDVPFQSGPWLGLDIPVIPAAQELLQPNQILQRRYTNASSGEWFELLIVHCGDVRDMLGHYPPVCYAANGWDMEDRAITPLNLAEGETEATRYRFSREQDFVRDEIRIINIFALPAIENEPFVPDYEAVSRAGRSRLRARLGSAQFQVIVPASLEEERAEEVIAVAVKLIEPVMHDVERGPL